MQPVERAPLGEKMIAKRQLLKQRLAGALVAEPHLHIANAMAVTATRLLPLLAVLEAVQVQLNSESVFHARRRKIQLHMAVAYAECLAPSDPGARHSATPFRP